jgi:hypothetical protein
MISPMSSLPPFDDDGLLPADYELDFQGLRESFLVTGAGGKSPTWDARGGSSSSTISKS